MDDFFNDPLGQSLVKAAIVSKYFDAWSKVLVPTVLRSAFNTTKRVAYIDLFAGPGRYKDGTKSTPIKVLEKAIADEKLRSMLVTIFNDLDEHNVRSLEKAIGEVPGIDTLKFKPEIWHNTVGEDVAKMFEGVRLVPTLFFVDPFGYKGLSLRLINSVLKDFGCDCIIFFNYNRVNMGLSNPRVREHMEALFGKDRVATLKPELDAAVDPEEREEVVVEALCQALKELGGQYTLPFRFKHPTKDMTSHHLIFVSKHPLGYKIMKEIMARESSEQVDGVATFEYNPGRLKQGLLFQLSRPLHDLGGMLLGEFAGTRLSVQDIFDSHNVDTPYVMRNYQEILRRLEDAGKVTTTRSPRNRKLNEMPAKVLITFP